MFTYRGKGALLPLTLFIIALCFILSATLYAQDVANKTRGSASPEEAGNSKNAEKPNPYANADISVKIIPSLNNTFGYDILVYGRPLVHQPGIPGLPGNEGFSTRERAQKVAELVIGKIRSNIMPPSVTIEELNNLGVLR